VPQVPLRPRRLHVAARAASTDRRAMSSLWSGDVPGAAVLSALWRPGDGAAPVAAPRNALDLDAQEFLPKEPFASGETHETFKPYGIGLVQLGDEVRVESRLTECDPAKLRFGMDVELALVPFRVDDDGRALPDDQVLRHEDQPIHARLRDLARDPGEGGRQELPQRHSEPERLPSQRDVRGADPRVENAQLPAHAVHVLLTR
jgi:hypothetical protein